jgi:hypothetical protein
LSWFDSLDSWTHDRWFWKGFHGKGGLSDLGDTIHDFGSLFSNNKPIVDNLIRSVSLAERAAGDSLGSAVGAVGELAFQPIKVGLNAFAAVDNVVAPPVQRTGVALLSLGEYDRFHRQGQSQNDYNRMLLDSVIHPDRVESPTYGELSSAVKNSAGSNPGDTPFNVVSGITDTPEKIWDGIKNWGESWAASALGVGAGYDQVQKAGSDKVDFERQHRLINPWEPEARKAWFENSNAPFEGGDKFENLVYDIATDPLTYASFGMGGVRRVLTGPKLLRDAGIIGDAAETASSVPKLLGFRRPGYTTLSEYGRKLDTATETESGGLYKTLKEFADNDSVYAANHKIVRRNVDSSVQTTAGYMLGQASTPEEVADVFRLLTKTGTEADNTATMLRLAQKHVVDDEYQYILDNLANGSRESRVAMMDNSGLPSSFVNDDVILRQHGAMIDKYVKSVDAPTSQASAAYRKGLEEIMGSPAPALTTDFAPTEFMQNLSMNRAARRAAKFGKVAEVADQKFSPVRQGAASATGVRSVYEDPDVIYQQITSSHPTIAVIDRTSKAVKNTVDFFHTFRPSGLARLNYGNESMREISAYVADADRILGGRLSSTGEGRAWVNRFMEAQHIGDKQSVVNGLTERMENLVLAKHPDLKVDAAKYLRNEFRKKTAQGLKQFQERGFISILNEDGLPVSIADPLLERTSANDMFLPNLRELDNAVSRHGAGTLNAWYSTTVNTGLDWATRFNDVFKVSALMRFGYTIRNITEAYLSMLASGMFFTSMTTVGGDALKAWTANRVIGSRHLVDNMLVKAGVREDLKVSQQKVSEQSAVLQALQNVEDHVSASLARAGVHVNPEDVDFVREIRNHLANGTPISAEALAWFDYKTETLQLAARLRAEHEGDWLFHGSPNAANSVKVTEPIAMSHNEGMANQWADRAHNYFSIENFNEQNLNLMGRNPKGAGERLFTEGMFHGSSSTGKITLADRKELQIQNWFFADFFATDSSQIAKKYASGKNGGGSVYRVTLKNGQRAKVLDLRDSMLEKTGLAQVAPEVLNSYVRILEERIAEYVPSEPFDSIESAFVDGLKKTVVAVKKEESGGGSAGYEQRAIITLSTNSFQAKALGDALKENGYDGLIHTGGVATAGRGRQRNHDVLAIFKNTNKINLKELPAGPIELSPAGLKSTAKMVERKRAMIQQALDRANAGEVVQMTRGAAGWRTMKPADLEKMLDDATLAKVNVERTLFRSRKAADVPVTKKVLVYGGLQDAKLWTNVPQSLRDALGVTSNAEWRVWMRDRKFDDPEVRQVMSQWGKENNVGKIELADRKAHGGHVVIAFPEFFSRSASAAAAPKHVVERHLHDYMGELRAGMNPIVPDADVTSRTFRWGTMAATRAERKEFYQNYRQNAGLNGLNNRMVHPDYDKETLREMVRNDLPDALRSLAQKQKDAEHQLRLRIAAHEQRVNQLERIGKKRVTGMDGYYKDIPGVGRVFVPGIYQNNTAEGQITHRLLSSTDSFESLSGYQKAYQAGPSAMVSSEITPQESRYFEAWSNILNHHFRDSASGRIDPLVERLMAGESKESLVNWLKGTKEGSDYRRNMSWQFRDLEKKIHDLDSSVRLYLPNDIRDAWASGQANESFLINKFVDQQGNLPKIVGRLVPTGHEASRESMNRGVWQSTTRWFFRHLGSIPEDTMARHPLARGFYKQYMDEKIGQAHQYLGRDLTIDEMNKLSNQGRVHAYENVRQTLFNIDRRSGAGSSRLVVLASPFYNAWDNQLRRWSGFLWRKPERFLIPSELISQHLTDLPIFDSQGNRVKNFNNVDLNKDWIVLPSFLTKTASKMLKNTPGLRPVGDVLENFAGRVPLKSMDVVFQGNPLRPDLGPLAAAPLYEFLKNKPSQADFLKFVFPTGLPEDGPGMFMASAIRNVYTVQNAMNNARFVSAYNMIAKHEQIQYEQGLRPDLPLDDEVMNKTKSYFMLKTLTNLTSPVSISYANDVTYLAEELRRMQKAYPQQGEADYRFLQAHPEAWAVLTPQSSNPSHLQARNEVTANLQRYHESASLASGHNIPEVVGFIGNYGLGAYDPAKFSQAAYQWQMSNSPAAGADTYRSKADSKENLALAKAQVGWVQFSKFTSMLEAQVRSLGYSLDNPNVARWVTERKTMFAKEVAATNKEWSNDYFSSDSTKYQRRADYFETLLTTDSVFMKDHGSDPLMKSIAVFLQTRNILNNRLLEREQQGGSPSAEAQDNADIYGPYLQILSDLKLRSTGFNDWFDKYFANDKVVARYAN